MDNLFSEIDCRSKLDSIVMRILRCAMDKAHEKVQSETGSIEFLHERSMFYELAVILVESGLSIIQEETDILESNREKVMSDLTEMRHWLVGRIKVMKLLINEKDRELIERTKNELKLRQVLESKDKEVIFFRNKLENQRTMSDNSLDFLLLVKNEASVEGKTSDSKSDTELLNEERFQQHTFYESYRYIPKGKPMVDSMKPEQNNVIQQMSSDIDILNETLDFAFGRRGNGEMVPIEKQWRCIFEKDILYIFVKDFIHDIKQRFEYTFKKNLDVTLQRNVEIVVSEKQLRCTTEKDILYVLIRGFISDIQQRFALELRNLLGDQFPLEFSNGNMVEFIGEITMLQKEIEAFYNRHDNENKSIRNDDFLGTLDKIRRTWSEPLPNVDQENDQEFSGNNIVAMLIKNKDNVLRKQLEGQNYMNKEVYRGERSTLHKKQKELDFLNIIIKRFITRLDHISSQSLKSIDEKYMKCKENFNMKNVFMPTMGDKVLASDCSCEIIKDSMERLKEELDNVNLQLLILEEIYLIIYEGVFKDYNVAYFDPIESTTTLLLGQFDIEYGNSKTFIEYFRDESILPETIGSLLKEVVYMEMFKTWKDERDDFYVEVQIRDDLYKFIMGEVVKDVYTKILKYLSLPYKKVEIDGAEEIKIQELNSMSKCSKIEKDLIVKSCLEIDQLYTCKELLIDLDQSHDISTYDLNTSSDDCVYTNTSLVVETQIPSQESIAKTDDNKMTHKNPLSVILAQLYNFYQMIQEFEVNVVQNLDMLSLRYSRLSSFE